LGINYINTPNIWRYVYADMPWQTLRQREHSSQILCGADSVRWTHKYIYLYIDIDIPKICYLNVLYYIFDVLYYIFDICIILYIWLCIILYIWYLRIPDDRPSAEESIHQKFLCSGFDKNRAVFRTCCDGVVWHLCIHTFIYIYMNMYIHACTYTYNRYIDVY